MTDLETNIALDVMTLTRTADSLARKASESPEGFWTVKEEQQDIERAWIRLSFLVSALRAGSNYEAA